MKNLTKILMLVGVVMVFLTAAYAAPPRSISVQGRLLSADGAPITTSTELNFYLTTSEGRNAPLYSSKKTVVPNDNGIFNVILEDIPATVAFDQQYYLSISVGGEVIQPPQPLTAAPYAIRAIIADNAASLEGRSLYQITSEVITMVTNSGDGSYVKKTGDTMTGTLKIAGQGITGISVESVGTQGNETEHAIFGKRREANGPARGSGVRGEGAGFSLGMLGYNEDPYDGGVGVYGEITLGNLGYAGYFKGGKGVKVEGQLETTGAIRSGTADDSIWGGLGVNFDNRKWAGYFQGDVMVKGNISSEGRAILGGIDLSRAIPSIESTIKDTQKNFDRSYQYLFGEEYKKMPDNMFDPISPVVADYKDPFLVNMKTIDGKPVPAMYKFAVAVANLYPNPNFTGDTVEIRNIGRVQLPPSFVETRNGFLNLRAGNMLLRSDVLNERGFLKDLLLPENLVRSDNLGALATLSTVGTDQLANNAVTSNKIAAGAVTDDKVGSISATKLTGTISPDRLSGSYNINVATATTANSLAKGGLTNFRDAIPSFSSLPTSPTDGMLANITTSFIQNGQTYRPGTYMYSAGRSWHPIDGANITTREVTGLGTLATKNTVSTSEITGLGSLATKNTVSISEITGLGSLATKNTVSTSEIIGLGTLATRNLVDASSVLLSSNQNMASYLDYRPATNYSWTWANNTYNFSAPASLTFKENVIASKEMTVQGGLTVNNLAVFNSRIRLGENVADDSNCRLKVYDNRDTWHAKFGGGEHTLGIAAQVANSGGVDLVVWNTNNWDQKTNLALQPRGGTVSIGGRETASGYVLVLPNDTTKKAKAQAWQTYSSRRWKDNVSPIPDALAKVVQLQGVSFNWKKDGKKDIGFIAEDVGQVVPEVVTYEDNGIDASGMDYARLTALLTEAIKEQQKQIEELKAEVRELKTKH